MNKQPEDDKTLELPLEAPEFSLDDDTPLACNRDQSGDTTCEACQ